MLARVEGGEVASKILAHAAEIDARSIVLGGRRRSGVAKVSMGSTAMDVLVSADRPVVVTGWAAGPGRGHRFVAATGICPRAPTV